MSAAAPQDQSRSFALKLGTIYLQCAHQELSLTRYRPKKSNVCSCTESRLEAQSNLNFLYFVYKRQRNGNKGDNVQPAVGCVPCRA
jgi:hypothetical protein